METTYHEWEKRRQERNGVQRRMPNRRKRKGKVELGVRERRRLVQLVICVALFLVVFVGKGIFPAEMAELRDRVLMLIRSDTDFKEVFSNLGRAISQGEPVLDTLGGLWVEVFGGGTDVSESSLSLKELALYQSQAGTLSGEPVTLAVRFGIPVPEEKQEIPSEAVDPGGEAGQTMPEAEAEPVVVPMEYHGPALPDNATMDRYSLSAVGVGETVTPALGWITSDFGWREHPVDGGEKFHNGVDLGVNVGTPVLAFADGVVDYIGESDIYGLYLQIRHAGGLTSFYAHCSALCVQQGQTVAAGEKVAESGDTGNATGPHLHLELKLNGTLLNPAYYIETS